LVCEPRGRNCNEGVRECSREYNVWNWEREREGEGERKRERERERNFVKDKKVDYKFDSFQ
jgi:hypothetical protein